MSRMKSQYFSYLITENIKVGQRLIGACQQNADGRKLSS